MTVKKLVILLSCFAMLEAGVIEQPTVEILQGPGSKTTIHGPDGSVLDAKAPGGTVVTDSRANLVPVGTAVLGASPVVAVKGPAGAIVTSHTLAGPVVVPAVVAAEVPVVAAKVPAVVAAEVSAVVAAEVPAVVAAKVPAVVAAEVPAVVAAKVPAVVAADLPVVASSLPAVVGSRVVSGKIPIVASEISAGPAVALAEELGEIDEEYSESLYNKDE